MYLSNVFFCPCFLCPCSDAVVHGLSAGGVGYLAVLHAQLFDQQPPLAFLPLFVICVIVHFLIRSRSADAKARAGQVRPLLQGDSKTGDEDAAAHGEGVVALPTSAHDGHLDLDDGLDSDHLDSSSMYSSPHEEDDVDNDSDRHSDGLLEVYGEGELDPTLFLDVQPGYVVEDDHSYCHNHVDDDISESMQNSLLQRSVDAQVLSHPNLHGIVGASSGLSSDYNTISDDVELEEKSVVLVGSEDM